MAWPIRRQLRRPGKRYSVSGLSRCRSGLGAAGAPRITGSTGNLCVSLDNIDARRWVIVEKLRRELGARAPASCRGLTTTRVWV